uniref:Non-structural protein 2 n=1 Tax=Ruddy turnstone rotavirus TaxID=2212774 RepID=A0A3G1RPG8_9REOV|nr:MAG: non-structural protein 2 [Ruddy turnstone rotavirus]
MTQSVALGDFIVKTDEGYMPSDRDCYQLDRFLSKDQKKLRESFKDTKDGRADMRKEMFLTSNPSRRFTQRGVVPMREIRTNTEIPSMLKSKITEWLLKTLEDEDTCEMFEEFVRTKFPDIFASSDKLARFALRLDDQEDLLHKNLTKALNAFGACFAAIKPTFATEGKSSVVRATDDGIVLEFLPVPEQYRIGKGKQTFYKLYPLSDDVPVQTFIALKHVAGNHLFAYHGHGHVRSVPYSEVPDMIRSMSKKTKNELDEISKNPLTVQCGPKFVEIVDSLRTGMKIEEIIKKATTFDKKPSK